MKIKVTVDSTNDLSVELMQKYDITAIPLTVNMGDVLYKDMVDIKSEDIFAFVGAGGALPKTSAVNVAEYREVFEECLKEYDAVIHINISSEMSTCYRNAVLAAEDLPVYPIDSRNLSTGSGHLALMACELAQQGMEAAEIAETLKTAAEKLDVSFVATRLDYLHKGGRCSAVAMLGANILKLRPCIEVRDGVMGVGKKYRGPVKRCLEQYVKDRLQNPESVDTRRVFVTYTYGTERESVDAVIKTVQETLPFDEVLETTAGCSIFSHCGDNTLGILFFRK